MNKAEFISYIAERNNCSKLEAEKTIDMFTHSVIAAIAAGKEISLIGFGHFSVSSIPGRTGYNPRTGEPLNIPAYNQVNFRVGQKLKDACNPKS